MAHFFELKDTNFSSFLDKLKFFSQNYGLKHLQTAGKTARFRWDNTLFGLGFDVEIEKRDERSFYYFYEQSSVVGLILAFAVFWLLLFKNNLIIFLALAGLTAIILILANRYLIERNLHRLFEQLDKAQMPEQQPATDKPAENILTCPACGETLTEYDEYCPSCGLYLGKTWKKQPVHRTGLYNIRLEYKYKPKDGQQNGN